MKIDFYNPNFKTLERCIENNLIAPGFLLSSWITKYTPCGTYGCLLGNDMIAEKIFIEDIDDGEKDCFIFRGRRYASEYSTAPFDLGVKIYGISRNISIWLFHNLEHVRDMNIEISDNLELGQDIEPISRNEKDRILAVNRIRKYLNYIKHKRKIMMGGTKKYEHARRNGGDWMIISQVSLTIAS